MGRIIESTKKAFTIIELLIVIVIIGILAGLTLNTLSTLDEKAKTADTTARLEQIRESMIASALISDRSDWWTEDELENCSIGTVSEDPYLDEIIEGCDKVGQLLKNGTLTLNHDTSRLRYDNDLDGSMTILESCAAPGGGVNVYTDLEDTKLIEEIDRELDDSDGEDCGRFRWSSATGQIYYMLAPYENTLQ